MRFPSTLALAVLAAGIAASPSSAGNPPTGSTLVELRPSARCTDAALVTAAGGAPVAPSLGLYLVPNGTVDRLLPILRARGSLRLSTPNRIVGSLAVTRVHRPPRADGVVAFRDRRGHAHSSPGGAGRDDHRLGNRRHPPRVPRARKHGDAERAGACGRRGRARYRGRIGGRRARKRPRHRRRLPRGPAAIVGCRQGARHAARDGRDRPGDPRRGKQEAPASSTSASGPTTRKP